MMELEGIWQICPNHHSACIICASVYSCSISQFFIKDGVGPVNLGNMLKAFGLEHL